MGADRGSPERVGLSQGGSSGQAWGQRAGQGLTELGRGGLGGGGALAQGRVALLERPLAYGAVRDAARARPVPLLVLHEDAAHQVLGAGQGDARGQLVGTDRSGPAGHPAPPNALPGSEPPYRVLVQWVNEQCVPKDGAAVLGHLGLLLCSVGPRSEVRGFWGEAEVPRARQRLAGSVQGPRVRGHGSSPIVPWWLSLGPQRSPGLGLGSRGQGPTHESTWFSKERMTG